MNEEQKSWGKFGLTDLAWSEMSPEERVMHYNRMLPIHGCHHKADLFAWPVDLRESYSFDPWPHIAHMDPCVKPAECFCQMCSNKIAVWRGGKS